MKQWFNALREKSAVQGKVPNPALIPVPAPNKAIVLEPLDKLAPVDKDLLNSMSLKPALLAKVLAAKTDKSIIFSEEELTSFVSHARELAVVGNVDLLSSLLNHKKLGATVRSHFLSYSGIFSEMGGKAESAAVKLIYELLVNNVPKDELDRFLVTAISKAVMGGKLDNVTLLFSLADEQVKTRCRNNELGSCHSFLADTVLGLAALNNHRDCYNFLIRNGFSRQQALKDITLRSIEAGDVALYKTLPEYVLSSDWQKHNLSYAIVMAIKKNHLDMLKHLRAKHPKWVTEALAKITSDDTEKMVQKNHFAMLQFLTEEAGLVLEGKDRRNDIFDEDICNPLKYALETKNDVFTKFLVSKGMKVKPKWIEKWCEKKDKNTLDFALGYKLVSSDDLKGLTPADNRLWYPPLHDAAPKESLRNKSSYGFNREVFDAVYPLLKLDYQLYSVSKNNYALNSYKLAVLFDDAAKATKFINDNVNWARPQADGIYRLLDFSLPDHDAWNPKAWGELCLKEGAEITKKIASAPAIEARLKRVPDSFEEVIDCARDIELTNWKEHPELARMVCLENGTQQHFDEGLAILAELKAKEPAHKNDLPPVHINGADIGENQNTYMIKLPEGHWRGLMLGAFSGCCQSITGNAARCAKNGMLSTKSGFYVVLQKKPGEAANPETDKILAQSFAWVGKDKSVVFESIESTHQSIRSMQSFMNFYKAAARDIVLNTPYTRVLMGNNNIPSVALNTVLEKNCTPVNESDRSKPDDYSFVETYVHSQEQVLITDREKELAKLASKNSTPHAQLLERLCKENLKVTLPDAAKDKLLALLEPYKAHCNQPEIENILRAILPIPENRQVKLLETKLHTYENALMEKKVRALVGESLKECDKDKLETVVKTLLKHSQELLTVVCRHKGAETKFRETLAEIDPSQITPTKEGELPKAERKRFQDLYGKILLQTADEIIMGASLKEEGAVATQLQTQFRKLLVRASYDMAVKADIVALVAKECVLPVNQLKEYEKNLPKPNVIDVVLNNNNETRTDGEEKMPISVRFPQQEEAYVNGMLETARKHPLFVKPEAKARLTQANLKNFIAERQVREGKKLAGNWQENLTRKDMYDFIQTIRKENTEEHKQNETNQPSWVKRDMELSMSNIDNQRDI